MFQIGHGAGQVLEGDTWNAAGNIVLGVLGVASLGIPGAKPGMISIPKSSVAKEVESFNTAKFSGWADNEAGIAGKTLKFYKNRFNSEIDMALLSSEQGIVLEGQVGKALNDKGGYWIVSLR